jgi:hypothetical protein
MALFRWANERTRQRRFRLLLCADRRTWWDVLAPAGQQAIEVAEQYAYGLATAKQLRAAHDLAERVGSGYTGNEKWWDPRTWPDSWDTDGGVVEAAAAAGQTIPFETVRLHFGGDSSFRFRADLLRDVFPNPFRPPPSIDPSWLRWNGELVHRLAKGAWENRRWEDLWDCYRYGSPDSIFRPRLYAIPREQLLVLSDALEEAGCSDAEILGHLRGPGPHILGCWVLDLLLGKE